MIAGGCIRDWMLGLEPKDIDVFVTVPENVEIRLPTNRAGWQLDEANPMPGEMNGVPGYGGLNSIVEIHNWLKGGQAVQIIRLRPDINLSEYVWTFDIDICTGRFDSSGLTIPHGAMVDLEAKVIHTNSPTQACFDRAERFLRKVSQVEQGWRITGVAAHFALDQQNVVDLG